MANVDPTQHRVLLVGPRVVPLKSFFEKRRYPVVAADSGVEGMAQLDTSPCDIVVLELNLGDLTASEFLMAARQGNPKTTFLLIDESSKAAHIVKAMQAGVDGYLATPPDDERLFYEVERHLMRTRAQAPEKAFDDDEATRTVMHSMAEAAALTAAIADRETQVIELLVQVKNANEGLRRLGEAQEALSGVLDGPLDGPRAQQLREQVQLAQLAGIELDSLRKEAQGAREVKARLQAELDAARQVLPAGNAARVDELERENILLQGRVTEALDAAAAAKEALSVSEDESTEALADVENLRQVIVERDTHIAALEATAEAQASSSASSLELARAAHSEALVAERGAHRDALAEALAASEAAHKEALAKQAQSLAHDVKLAVAKEGARLEKMHTEAMAQARNSGADDVDKKLEAQRVLMAKQTQAAVDKATDSQLQLEEARTRIEFLEQEARRIQAESSTAVERVRREAEERVKGLQASCETRLLVEQQDFKKQQRQEQEAFKKEKMRLIEEKQAAASGSQEAAVVMERFSAENVALKKQNAELLANKQGLQDAAAAAAERVRLAAGEVTRARDEAAQAAARVNDVVDTHKRVDAAMGAVQAHARNLEEELAAERRRADAAVAVAAGIPALAAAHARALTEAAEAHQRALERCEAAQRDALAGVRAELQALQQSSEAQLAQQRQRLEDLRSEAQAAQAQATQFIGELQRRTQDLEPITTDRDDLRARLASAQSDAEIQRAQLLGQLSERQAEVDSLRDQLSILRSTAPSSSSPDETEGLRARLAQLERSSTTDPAVMATVRSLVDAIEPLRWGLGSAIDYMHPFETNDQSLAGHVRSLRLLQATLARLATESAKNGS